MPELRLHGHPSDTEEQVPEGGEGLDHQGVSLPWLRHALSHVPDEGAGGDGGRGGAHPGSSTTGEATEGDPAFMAFVRDARRRHIKLGRYLRRYGILGKHDIERIREWERQGFDFEREITDCE